MIEVMQIPDGALMGRYIRRKTRLSRQHQYEILDVEGRLAQLVRAWC